MRHFTTLRDELRALIWILRVLCELCGKTVTEIIATPRRNWWSLSSLTLGIASLLLSFIAYVPFIPFLSLMSFPLGLCAMVQ